MIRILVIWLAIGSHSLTAGTSVKINEEGLFTRTKDGNATEHKYPRASDPFYDTAIPINGVRNNNYS